MSKFFKYSTVNWDRPKTIQYATDAEILKGVKKQKLVKWGLDRFKNPVQRKAFEASLDRALEGRVAGTIFPGPTGKKHSLLSTTLREAPRAARRNVIAHELFHAKTPVLGNSEILAHAYGGIKSKAGLFKKQGPIHMLGHALKTRPGRSAVELGLLAGAGRLGYKGLKRLIRRRI